MLEILDLEVDIAKTTAKTLLDRNCSNLNNLVDALINLAEDKGYLVGKPGFENSIPEINSLIYRLRDRILQVASK